MDGRGSGGWQTRLKACFICQVFAEHPPDAAQTCAGRDLACLPHRCVFSSSLSGHVEVLSKCLLVGWLEHTFVACQALC